MKRYLWFAIIVLLPVADVGSLFLLSKWIGVIWTLLLVAFSTATGLFACKHWLKRIQERNEKIKSQYNIHVPPDVVLIQSSEAILSVFAVGCFLFPGLLSDLMGFVLALPHTQKGFVEKVMVKAQKEAKAQGKTLEIYLYDKMQERSERNQNKWDPLESTCRHASLSIL